MDTQWGCCSEVYANQAAKTRYGWTADSNKQLCGNLELCYCQHTAKKAQGAAGKLLVQQTQFLLNFNEF